MMMLADILANRLLIGVIAALVLAQIIKTITNSARGRKFSWSYLIYGVGGMPSSHTAVVTCLTISLLLLQGISYLFVASLVFSLLVIRDALGVRHAVGEEAKVINKLEKTVWKGKESKQVHLGEIIGHTPSEVAAGVALGTIVAFLVVYL